MTDYAKKKNDELAALCKERGLPHTGKKAELVKRLEDSDAQSTKQTGDGADTTADTDAVPQQSATQVEEDKLAAQPAQTDAAEASKDGVEPSTDEKAESTPENFALGLQERTLDEEIAKRKKRAEKFGLDISQDETLKQLERAKRFGTTNVPGLLNQALPERAERSKKRGREGREEKDDRKRSRQRGAGDRPQKEQKEQKETKTAGFPAWMTDKDREAAERRKAKFTSTD